MKTNNTKGLDSNKLKLPNGCDCLSTVTYVYTLMHGIFNRLNLGVYSLYVTIFKSNVASSNTSPIDMSIIQESLNGQRLNTKQAHTAHAKGKEKKAVTLVQIDKKTEFSLNHALAEKFSRLQKDYNWILDHKDELSVDYPEKYIAVQNYEVRFSADTVEALMQEISARNEQVENFAVEFMSRFPRSFLFRTL